MRVRHDQEDENGNLTDRAKYLEVKSMMRALQKKLLRCKSDAEVRMRIQQIKKVQAIIERMEKEGKDK